jgi:hypothetical protein
VTNAQILSLIAILIVSSALPIDAADEAQPAIELRDDVGPKPAIGGIGETFEFRISAKAPTDRKISDWSWQVSRAELRRSNQHQPEAERLTSEKWQFEPADLEARLRVQLPEAGYWRLTVRATPRRGNQPRENDENGAKSVEVVLPEVTVASVRMASSGAIRVVQSARKHETTVVAVVSPPEIGIRWSLKDPIYRRPYFSHSSVGRTDGRHDAVVRLDKTKPGWNRWTEDSVITVTAMPVGTDCEASCEVEAWKFRRGGRTAPGSGDVLVPVPFAGSGLIHQHIEREHKQMRGFTAQAASDRLWNSAPQTGSTIPRTGAFGMWHIHYRSLDDVGDGRWHINSGPIYFGKIEVSGKLADPRIGSRSSVDAAGAVWAGFDGAEVPLSQATLGRGVGGEPRTLGMSLPRPISSANIELAEGVSFEATAKPDGHGILQAEDAHVGQTAITVERTLQVAACAHVVQLPDADWMLHAGASLGVEVPTVVWIRFSPDF